ncbi:MAG: biotin transporter BioY [Agathobacter sp.]|nr:biotin transporter BioY [Agathobacter sp.]
MSTNVKKTDIYNLTKTALCIALLCVSSYLVLPLPFTPIVISLHTIMVNLIGLVLKPKTAAITMLTYLLMGLIGLPVFSAGTAGAGKLFGPTGGFYFGFLFAVIAISLLKGRKNSLARYVLVTICVGLPIQHFCAILMMCFHNGFQIQAAVVTVSLPFVLGDIVKCIMASIAGVALNKALKTTI